MMYPGCVKDFKLKKKKFELFQKELLNLMHHF